MESKTLYWLPYCSTCRKALKYLQEKGIEIENFHNLKEQTLSPEEIAQTAEKVGGAGDLFSKRAVKYREMKLSERNLSEQEMLDLMAKDYTFIRRPVLVADDKAIAGFSEKTYEKFLKDNEQ